MVLVAVVAGLGAALGLLLTQGTTRAAPGATQLASVRAGCVQWLGANPDVPGSAQWCTEMVGSMSQSMDGAGVGPQMMWGDSDHLVSACERWMATSPSSGPVPRSWCTSMVSWMTTHMGRWSGQDSWGASMGQGRMLRTSGP